MLIYLMRGGRLPWQDIVATPSVNPAKPTKSERNLHIGRLKETISPAKLCQGFPPEVATFLSYTRNLTFSQTPDYIYMRKVHHAPRPLPADIARPPT